MILTPDSTGSVSSSTSSASLAAAESDSPGPGASTPNRRPAAVYPNMKSSAKTLKPFSRSAAKRESVLALGSIEHLQHYFTKTGLAANRDPLEKLHYGLVPAIGGAAYVPNPTPSSSSTSTSPSTTNTSSSPDPFTVSLPLSPHPYKPSFPPNLPKTYETDPDSLLPGVADDLNAVARAWNLDNDTNYESYNPPIVTVTPDTKTNHALDILELLKTTTRAIRSTRNYLVSLPDESALSPVHSRAHFRPSVLGPGQPIGPRHHAHDAGSSSTSSTSKIPPDKNAVRQQKQNAEKRGPEDPSALVRRSALDVLAVLREVEERYRLPLSDEAYDAQSDGGVGGGHSRGPTIRATSPDPISYHELDARHHDHDGDLSITYSLIQIQVGDRLEEVPVWEDEGSDSEREEKEKRELWDERLVLGSGWLYRQDVRMEELQKEKDVVRGYLDVVDKVIFGDGLSGGGVLDEERKHPVMRERGWEREKRKMMRSRSKGRRVSAGDGEGRSSSLATVMKRSREENRRVSTGVVELLNGMRLTEEPEEIHLDGVGGMGSMAEVEEEDGEESVDEEEMPEWSKRRRFVGDDLGRAHALLSAFLPSYLLPVLGSASSRTEFLSSLSSGQLLCVAYNMCVRKSKRPWGYVSKDSIHDIVTLEKEAETEGSEGRKKGWTFRRTDNLRLWIGALKLRYLLPIQTPNQPLNQSSLSSLQLLGQLQASGTGIPSHIRDTPVPSPTRTRFASATEPVIEFDARVVARKDEGWDDMLEKVLVRWMWKAVEEKRTFR